MMVEPFRIDASEVSSSFNGLVGDLTSFLRQDPNKVKEFRKVTLTLFNWLKTNGGAVGIKSLIVDGFDAEQIWAQIDLDNEACLKQVVNEISTLSVESRRGRKSAKGSKSNNRNRLTTVEDEDNDDAGDVLEHASSDEDEDIDRLLGSRELHLSNFEKEQKKIQEKIAELEEENLGARPWKLTGEVTGDKRPENSLLEEYLQYDFVSRPAPIIDEEVATKLEDVIKQRIKDGIWDDVERKAKPVEQPFEYKRRLLLDQEKGKIGLAEVYEKDYLGRQQEEKVEGESESHKEIRKLMSNLFLQLDSLSSYHYTPKPPEPEIKVVNNLPAVSAEEAIPAAVSEATLLAPEEVVAKSRRPVQNETEKESTDRKRERRLKKKRQKIKSKSEKMKKETEKISLTNKYNKLEKEKIKRLVKKISSGKEIKL